MTEWLEGKEAYIALVAITSLLLPVIAYGAPKKWRLANVTYVTCLLALCLVVVGIAGAIRNRDYTYTFYRRVLSPLPMSLRGDVYAERPLAVWMNTYEAALHLGRKHVRPVNATIASVGLFLRAHKSRACLVADSQYVPRWRDAHWLAWRGWREFASYSDALGITVVVVCRVSVR